MACAIQPVKNHAMGQTELTCAEDQSMNGWFASSIWETGPRALAASLMLAATTPALADPALEKLRDCGVSSPQQARSFGDLLSGQGAYQHAGKCYEAAGHYDLAIEPT